MGTNIATLLQKTQDARLAYILKHLQEEGIRFPVADIHRKTGITKSNVSEVLGGVRQLSDGMFKKICEAYGLDGKFPPFAPENPMNWERAAIKALTWKLADALAEISELKGRPRPASEYLEELDKNTNSILHDLRKSQ